MDQFLPLAHLFTFHHGHSRSHIERFRGHGNSLTFSQVAATMKMCPDNMDQEQLFLTVLDGTASFKISGQKLHLYDPMNELIGSFKAGH